MRVTRLCIVRHGETDWNIVRRIQGQLDIKLNAVGRAQAAATARGLERYSFSAIYSSDLARTIQTAAVIADRWGFDVRPEAGLRERHYGLFQGRTADEMVTRNPQAHASFVQRDPDYDFGNGETLKVFAARVIATIERIAFAHAGQTLLLVTHGGALDVFYRRALGRELSGPRNFPIPNAALNWIDVSPLGWRLQSWGDRSHLEHTLEQPVE